MSNTKTYKLSDRRIVRLRREAHGSFNAARKMRLQRLGDPDRIERRAAAELAYAAQLVAGTARERVSV